MNQAELAELERKIVSLQNRLAAHDGIGDEQPEETLICIDELDVVHYIDVYADGRARYKGADFTNVDLNKLI